MKKQFLLFGLLIAIFSACKKESFNTPKQAVIDDEKIQAYIAANHINATRASSGIYYQIVIPGSGPSPGDTSTIQVTYTGKLLNGTVFQPQATSLLPLASTIVGWRFGIPMINKGARLRLIVPSTLAYGSLGTTNIPPNSDLDFTIDLLGFY